MAVTVDRDGLAQVSTVRGSGEEPYKTVYKYTISKGEIISDLGGGKVGQFLPRAQSKAPIAF